MILQNHDCPTVVIEEYNPSSPQFAQTMFERHLDVLLETLMGASVHPVEFTFAVISMVKDWRCGKHLAAFPDKIQKLAALLLMPPENLMLHQELKPAYYHLFVGCLGPNIKGAIHYFYDELLAMRDENYEINMAKDRSLSAWKIARIAAKCFILLDSNVKKKIMDIKYLLCHQPEITFNQASTARRTIYNRAAEAFSVISDEEIDALRMPMPRLSIEAKEKQVVQEGEWVLLN